MRGDIANSGITLEWAGQRCNPITQFSDNPGFSTSMLYITRGMADKFVVHFPIQNPNRHATKNRPIGMLGLRARD
jgi:hypothetical protein